VAPCDGDRLRADRLMDHVSGKPACISDRVRAAARDAGVLPEDPLGPLVEAIGGVPDEIESRMAPLLAQMRNFTAAAEQAAGRPPAALTPAQIDKLGRQLAARCDAALEWRTTVIFLCVLAAAGVFGGVIDRYLLPPPPEQLICGAMLADGSRQPICYRLDGPPPASQDMPQQPAAPAAKTKVK
jgi:hypothetical protein